MSRTTLEIGNTLRGIKPLRLLAKAKRAISSKLSPVMTGLLYKHKTWWAISALLLLLTIGLAYGLYQVWNPHVALLVDRGGARWIRYPEPYRLTAHHRDFCVVFFRRTFSVTRPVEPARLEFTAFRSGAVKLDDRLVLLPEEKLAAWKTPRTAVLSALVLSPGAHELRFSVKNIDAPAALLAQVPALGLFSGEDWEVSFDEKSWVSAESATRVKRLDQATEFPMPLASLLRLSPVLLPLFLLVFLVSLFKRRLLGNTWSMAVARYWTPANLRWALLGFWAVLAANNLFKLPEPVGFDVPAHLDYVRWLMEKRTLPLAPDGWQMFQPPLFYLVCAPFYGLCAAVTTPDLAAQLLRLIPLACGALQVQLVYLAVRRVFADRPDLQIVGLLIGGLLPMNLYLCQYVGNEPLAAVLTGTAFYCLIRPDAGPVATDRATGGKMIGLAAVFLGLALLTKMTPVVLLPLFIGYLVWQLRQQTGGWQQTRLLPVGFCGIVLAISGGFYLRNWVVLGRPFIGGWESQALPWWQDPGFRTVGQVFRFGDVFIHPINAATNSFGNGLYSTFWADGYLSGVISYAGRPPWNYDLMLAGVILGLLPALAMLLGLGAALAGRNGPHRPVLLLAGGGVLLLLAAMLHLFLTLPIYSTVKASYTSGLTVAYALLAAAGFEWFTRRSWLNAVAYGLLACWAVAAMAAYFIW